MYSRENKLLDRREMLRVKVKSLAEEARLIKREEQRTWGVLREELHNHRVLQVRRAARHAHLAYGLIKGRSIEEMEGETSTWRQLEMYPGQWQASTPNWSIVRRMIREYGAPGDEAAFDAMFVNPKKLDELKPVAEHRIRAVPKRESKPELAAA